MAATTTSTKTVLWVNGVRRETAVDPDARLLDVIRDELGLTGTRYGCGEGECGACTVLLDNVPQRSCQLSLKDVGRAHLTTIEGIAKGERLHPVQQAFLEEDAMQCGYCTSGMVVAAVGLLHRTPHPSDEQIRQGMEGNVCRCGTYSRIVAAIRRASHA